MQAVRFDRYGDEDVLEVRSVEAPTPAPDRVVVQVRATGLNPGEIAVREGAFHERAPADFPSGQGTDLAGVIDSVAGETAFAAGDAVLGWTDARAAQAELVSVPVGQLVPKPDRIPWEVAGSLFVTSQAGLASVRAVSLRSGETVVVSAAAGGVGSIAAQLARREGAVVLGLASEPNHRWLRSHDVIPLTYGDGLADRVRDIAPEGIDAFIDTFGAGYVDLALELGVPAERINTIIDFEAAQRHPGIHTDGTYQIASLETLEEITELVASGQLEVRVDRTYPMTDVREAYRQLAAGQHRGKIVLEP